MHQGLVEGLPSPPIIAALATAAVVIMLLSVVLVVVARRGRNHRQGPRAEDVIGDRARAVCGRYAGRTGSPLEIRVTAEGPPDRPWVITVCYRFPFDSVLKTTIEGDIRRSVEPDFPLHEVRITDGLGLFPV